MPFPLLELIKSSRLARVIEISGLVTLGMALASFIQQMNYARDAYKAIRTFEQKYTEYIATIVRFIDVVSSSIDLYRSFMSYILGLISIHPSQIIVDSLTSWSITAGISAIILSKSYSLDTIIINDIYHVRLDEDFKDEDNYDPVFIRKLASMRPRERLLLFFRIMNRHLAMVRNGFYRDKKRLERATKDEIQVLTMLAKGIMKKKNQNIIAHKNIVRSHIVMIQIVIISVLLTLFEINIAYSNWNSINIGEMACQMISGYSEIFTFWCQ